MSSLAEMLTAFVLMGSIGATDPLFFKVLSLNTWGMPDTFLSHLLGFASFDKYQRMKAIGDLINKAEYDIYLLQELWMRHDHNTIHGRIPKGWFMTPLSVFTTGNCDGVVLPTSCSGLAIVSKFPFKDMVFRVYPDNGNFPESAVSKGIGVVRIEPFPGHIVGIVVTHTCASNKNSRQKQVKLLVEVIKSLSHVTDFIILGGDFNSDPLVDQDETTLKDITSIMVGSVEEFFHKRKDWLTPRLATYGNPKNTYSSSVPPPVHYDFIFQKANHGNKMATNSFAVPLFRTRKGGVSLSDHEAVTAELFLTKN